MDAVKAAMEAQDAESKVLAAYFTDEGHLVTAFEYRGRRFFRVQDGETLEPLYQEELLDRAAFVGAA